MEGHPCPEGCPLERTWAIWYNCRERPSEPGRSPGSRRASPKGKRPADRAAATYTAPARIGSFGSVETLWRYMNNLPAPSALTQDVNLFLFQEGVDPLWEHPANRKGGRWTYTFDGTDAVTADGAWQSTYLALAGETLSAGSEVTGITATRRQHYIRLSVWTRNREDETAVLAIGNSLRAHTTVPQLEYQDHGAAMGESRHVLA